MSHTRLLAISALARIGTEDLVEKCYKFLKKINEDKKVDEDEIEDDNDV